MPESGSSLCNTSTTTATAAVPVMTPSAGWRWNVHSNPHNGGFGSGSQSRRISARICGWWSVGVTAPPTFTDVHHVHFQERTGEWKIRFLAVAPGKIPLSSFCVYRDAPPQRCAAERRTHRGWMDDGQWSAARWRRKPAFRGQAEGKTSAANDNDAPRNRFTPPAESERWRLERAKRNSAAGDPVKLAYLQERVTTSAQR